MEKDAESQTGDPITFYKRMLIGSLDPLVSAAFELGNWSKHVDWSKRLRAEGYLSTGEIIEAFQTIKRYDFLPDYVKAQNAMDVPLEIGYNQTNSQPSTVANMQEWLRPEHGQRILDFGSGSGWTTALMGKLVGASGVVIGLERIPELVDFGRANIARYNLPGTEIRQAGEQLGLPDEEPFDRILISAHLPEEWLETLELQLKPHGGRLVAPLIADEKYGTSAACDMVAVTRYGQAFQVDTLAKGYSFVPVVHETDGRFSLTK